LRFASAPACLGAAFGLRLLVLVAADLALAALLPVAVVDQLEELGQHCMQGRALIPGASADEASNIGRGNRSLAGVVHVHEARVDPVLQQGQVGRVLEVVADVTLVVVQAAVLHSSRL
jgi:hypothetical protein